jgi:hypothetical protein
MPTRILHAATRAAYAAAPTQQEQCEAVRDAFGGNVTLRIEGAGGQHLRTMTLAPFTVNTATPRGIVCGSVLADTAVAPNTPGAAGIAPVRWEFRSGSTPIFETTDIVQGPIRTLCAPRFGAVVFTANPLLPVKLTPSWVTALAPNTWTEIAGTNMSTTANLRQPQFDLTSNQDPIGGWGSWAIDDTYLYLTGGGHTNGPDNAVYGIELASNTPTWTRVVDGSAQADWVRYQSVNGQQVYASYNLDGLPSSAHVYRWWAFAQGRIVRYRFYQDYGLELTTTMPIAPNNEGWTNILNPITKQWALGIQAPSFVDNDPYGGNPYQRDGMVSDGNLVYALWQNRRYGDSSVRLMSYNVTTNAYTQIGPDHGTPPGNFGMGGVALDSVRNEMVIISENANQIQRYNLSTGIRTGTALTGAQANFSIGWDSSYMGACYDSTRDVYYAYSGQAATGKTLVQINPASSYAATAVSTTGNPATTTPSGMNGRMAYFAEWDVIVIQPAWESGLWALRRS